MEPIDQGQQPVAAIGLERRGFGGVFEDLRSLMNQRRSRQSRLISALNDVASAVSSAISVDQALAVIVDRVKSTTGSDKVIVQLLDDGLAVLDPETLTVRGQRRVHDQSWWEQRLDYFARQDWSHNHPVCERNDANAARLACVPITVRDKTVGLLCCINSIDRPFKEDQLEFLAVVAAFAAAAVEGARHAEQSRYVLVASERDRIAREMHDGVVQSLFSISLGLEVCKKQLETDPAAVPDRLEELQEHLKIAMGELRRFIYDLRPMQLKELGLVGATEYWIREVTIGRDVRGGVTVEGEIPRMSPAEEALLYRVMKEAVSNVVRHSGARTFSVHFDFEPGAAHMWIDDDGCGFDSGGLSEGGGAQIGLASIRERIASEHGQLSIVSAAGEGTTVRVDLDLEAS